MVLILFLSKCGLPRGFEMFLSDKPSIAGIVVITDEFGLNEKYIRKEKDGNDGRCKQ